MVFDNVIYVLMYVLYTSNSRFKIAWFFDKIYILLILYTLLLKHILYKIQNIAFLWIFIILQTFKNQETNKNLSVLIDFWFVRFKVSLLLTCIMNKSIHLIALKFVLDSNNISIWRLD